MYFPICVRIGKNQDIVAPAAYPRCAADRIRQRLDQDLVDHDDADNSDHVDGYVPRWQRWFHRPAGGTDKTTLAPGYSGIAHARRIAVG